MNKSTTAALAPMPTPINAPTLTLVGSLALTDCLSTRSGATDGGVGEAASGGEGGGGVGGIGEGGGGAGEGGGEGSHIVATTRGTTACPTATGAAVSTLTPSVEVISAGGLATRALAADCTAVATMAALPAPVAPNVGAFGGSSGMVSTASTRTLAEETRNCRKHTG